MGDHSPHLYPALTMVVDASPRFWILADGTTKNSKSGEASTRHIPITLMQTIVQSRVITDSTGDFEYRDDAG